MVFTRAEFDTLFREELPEELLMVLFKTNRFCRRALRRANDSLV